MGGVASEQDCIGGGGSGIALECAERVEGGNMRWALVGSKVWVDIIGGGRGSKLD